MRLCPSQLQLSLNPLDVSSVMVGDCSGRWHSSCWSDGSRGLCAADSGGGRLGWEVFVPLGGWSAEDSACFWTDLVTPLADSLLFLMIKVEPEGSLGHTRWWYERISFTLTLAAVCGHDCLNLRNESESSVVLLMVGPFNAACLCKENTQTLLDSGRYSFIIDNSHVLFAVHP